MYYNKVEICGVDTSKLKTLSGEDTRRLLEASRSGDAAARRELISGNLRLVLSIIQKFTNRREELDDLFQIGCVGLIKAIDNFNLDLDVRFSTYAVPMIIGEVRRYLRDNNAIRVSRSVRDLAYRALSAKEELSREKGRDPTIEEIAKRLEKNGIETTKERVVYALEAIVEPVSLYEPVFGDGNGDGAFLLDQISDGSAGDDSWLESIALGEAMKKLGERERSIINMRFFSGKTQMEIAEEIGISQAQVSRLEKAALDKMKKQL